MKIWSELTGNCKRVVGNGLFVTQLRGYVQLTWKNNYEKYTQLLNIDLVNNPNLALEHDVAVFILVHGFKNGIFTGRKLEDYINIGKIDYYNARRCINGLDRATTIMNNVPKFLTLIQELEKL